MVNPLQTKAVTKNTISAVEKQARKSRVANRDTEDEQMPSKRRKSMADRKYNVASHKESEVRNGR